MWPLVLILLQAPVVEPASLIELRYAPKYDDLKHRQHARHYPTEAQIREQVSRFKVLWQNVGPYALKRIRLAALVEFPTKPFTVYLIGCGENISDPLTIALFKCNGKEFLPLSDNEFWEGLVHELLHQVAESQDYISIRQKLAREYSSESTDVVNHILVVAFETRIWGLDAVVKRYREDFLRLRAVTLAQKHGLTSKEPILQP